MRGFLPEIRGFLTKMCEVLPEMSTCLQKMSACLAEIAERLTEIAECLVELSEVLVNFWIVLAKMSEGLDSSLSLSLSLYAGACFRMFYVVKEMHFCMFSQAKIDTSSEKNNS